MTDVNLPRNIEAEAALLGALLIDNGIIDILPPELDEAHFFEPLHGRLFAKTIDLVNAGTKVTPVTLKPYFDADPAMQEVGGVGYLAKLTGSGAGLIGARDFARQIVDLAILRELIAVGTRLIESARDTSQSIDPGALVDEAAGMLERVSGTNIDADKTVTAMDCVDEVIGEWDQPVNGVSCGCIPELDQGLGVMRPTKLTILAGRPGSGKTAVAVSVANGVARRGMDPEDDKGGAVLFVSHEMPAMELGGRLIADTAAYSRPIPYSHIEGGTLGMDEREQVRRIRDGMKNLPLHIIPMPTITIPRLRGLVRKKKRYFEKRGIKLKLLVVDYLQLMEGTKKGKDEGRVSEISEISRGLKRIAMEEDLHVLALSQLSRALEQREDKRPRLNDLRESGSLEQDADNVVGVYSAFYYHEHSKPAPGSHMFDTKIVEWEADREALKDALEIGILKRRAGRSGFWVPAKFYRENQAVRGCR